MATIPAVETLKVSGNFDSDRTTDGVILTNSPTNRMCKGTLYISCSAANTSGSQTVTVKLDNTIIAFLDIDMNNHYNRVSGATNEVNQTYTNVIMGPDQEMTVESSGNGDFYVGYSGAYLTNLE